MTQDLSVLNLLVEASLIVQLVMLILLATSIASWTFIFAKHRELKKSLHITDEFELKFRSNIKLSTLYEKMSSRLFQPEGVEKIFIAGYREFAKMSAYKNIAATIPIENSQRVMRIAMSRELEKLNQRLSFLATTGSTSPYVGLFGTVWGIMNSFRSLSNTQQATLAQVAPGIAEALIATAMGLFAAIPAVIAYNRFTVMLEKQTERYELFIDEFIVLLLQKQASK